MATINLQDFPDELYRKFKAQCALRGITVKEAIIEMMALKVAEGEK